MQVGGSIFYPDDLPKPNDLEKGCKDMGGKVLKPFFSILRGVMNVAQIIMELSSIYRSAASLFSSRSYPSADASTATLK